MLEDFLSAYIEAALWSTNDESTPAGGEPLDANYGPDDLAPETLAKMRDECERFLVKAAGLIEAERLPEGRSDNAAAAGHDFWLTRNGHGAGFWDGDWPIAGDELTKLCGWRTEFPEVDLYVGDDGRIYQS